MQKKYKVIYTIQSQVNINVMEQYLCPPHTQNLHV